MDFEDMPEAPYSAHESKRLAAVQKTRMVGTPAEERFDKITRLACRLFDVPMAVIDIVGEKVAWLKSAQGMKGVIGLRKDSYCHYTVLEDQICLVTDARIDARFFDSAFATTWVAYAGVPLHFDGERVGVLCVGDNKPRQFSEELLESLYDLASIAEEELNLCVLSETQIVLAQTNDELERKNRIDPLTHGWNRSAIFDIAKTELSHIEPNSCLAMMMIDVDHFKAVNDSYGHLAGDLVLSVVAEKIRACIRPTDAVGRYGGDEFLVVLNDISKHEAEELGQRICNEIAKMQICFEERMISVTCSIGCAAVSTLDDPHLLIKRADQALYQAKAAGRGRVILG